MKDYKGRTRTRQEQSDKQHPFKKKRPQALHGNPRISEQPGVSIEDTPFQPAPDRHVPLLAAARSDSHRESLVKQLQRSYGNAYVQHLLRSMGAQAKLTVSDPDDVYEREADGVARAVADAISSQAQRQPEEEELQARPAADTQRQEEEEELLQAKSASDVQRQEEEEELMMKAGPDRPSPLSAVIESRIDAARTGGEPLPEAARASLEPVFGHDFGDVRVHASGEADTLSRQLEAQAFTTGKDIFFRQGAYRPDTDAGKVLLAHELTHVVQQSGNHIQRKEDIPGDSEEPPKTTKDPKEIATKVLQAAMETEEGKRAINQLRKGTTKEGAIAVDVLAAVTSSLFAANMDLPKTACALITKVAKIELDKDIELGFQPIYKGKLTGKPKEWGGMVTLTIKRW